MTEARGSAFDGFDFVVNTFNDARSIATLEVVKDATFPSSIELAKIGKKTISCLLKLGDPGLDLRFSLLRVQVRFQ